MIVGVSAAVSMTLVAPIERVKLLLQVQDGNKIIFLFVVLLIILFWLIFLPFNPISQLKLVDVLLRLVNLLDKELFVSDFAQIFRYRTLERQSVVLWLLLCQSFEVMADFDAGYGLKIRNENWSQFRPCLVWAWDHSRVVSRICFEYNDCSVTRDFRG